METRLWLPKADYEKKKQIWEEQRKEKERLAKIRYDAKGFMMNNMLMELYERAKEDPYYNEVLEVAKTYLKEIPDFLKEKNKVVIEEAI